MKILQLCFALILLISCGKRDLAGGSIEIPPGLAQDTLRSPEGVALAHIKLSLIPLGSNSSDPIIEAFSDAKGAFKIQAIPGVDYRLILLDSVNQRGQSIIVHWDSIPVLPQSFDLQPLANLRLLLSASHFKQGRIGLEGTAYWQNLQNPSDTFNFGPLPPGNYKLVLQSDSLKLSYTLMQTVQLPSLGILSPTIALYSKNLSADSMLLPWVEELGFRVKWISTESNPGAVEALLVSSSIDNPVVNWSDFNPNRTPVFCLSPTNFWGLGMEKDTLQWQSRFQNTAVQSIWGESPWTPALGSYISTFSGDLNLVSGLNGNGAAVRYFSASGTLPERIAWGLKTDSMPIQKQLFQSFLARLLAHSWSMSGDKTAPN